MSTMCNLCPKYGSSAVNKRGATNGGRLYSAELKKVIRGNTYMYAAMATRIADSTPMESPPIKAPVSGPA